MVKIKNFLVVGAIKSAFKFIGKILYKILRFLNLELILLYGIIGLILELGWGLITKTHTSYVIYHVLAAVILLYAILNTIIKILHLGSRKAKKGKTVQIVSEEVK